MAGESESKAHKDETPTSPMHSPPLQQMQQQQQDDQYDPQRIPTSVFARSDTLTPAEWSAVSNESLFSLHGIGIHPSMTREHDSLLNEEVKRLTELSKTGELSTEDLKELKKLVGISKSNEFFRSINNNSSSSPSPRQPQQKEKEAEVVVVVKEGKSEGVKKDEEKEAPKTIVPLEKDEKKHIQRTSTTSRKSDGSVRISFAFPILTNVCNGGANKGCNSVVPPQIEGTTPNTNSQQQAADHQGTSQQQTSETVAAPEGAVADPKTKNGRRSCCFSWLSCFSWCSCFSCSGGCSCFSCSSCSSCFSCGGCTCFSCCSCCPCSSCRPTCFSCCAS